MRRQLLKMEYEDSVTRIKLAKNKGKAGETTQRPLGSAHSPLPAPMTEGREVGRKAKRAVEEDGEYLPPQKRKPGVQ